MPAASRNSIIAGSLWWSFSWYLRARFQVVQQQLADIGRAGLLQPQTISSVGMASVSLSLRTLSSHVLTSGRQTHHGHGRPSGPPRVKWRYVDMTIWAKKTVEKILNNNLGPDDRRETL